MATYGFAVEATSNAFGIADRIPRGAWHQVSRHTTLGAARKAVQRDADEMTRRCGPAAWDHHTRIIALRDTTLTIERGCLGWTDWATGSTHYCTADRGGGVSETVRLDWPAGMPEPQLTGFLSGWQSDSQCPVCAALEETSRRRYEEVSNA